MQNQNEQTAELTIAEQIKQNYKYHAALIICHNIGAKIITGLHDHFLFILSDGSFLMFSRTSKEFNVVNKTDAENEPAVYYVVINESITMQVRFFDNSEVKSIPQIFKKRPKQINLAIVNAALAGIRDIFRAKGI